MATLKMTKETKATPIILAVEISTAKGATSWKHVDDRRIELTAPLAALPDIDLTAAVSKAIFELLVTTVDTLEEELAALTAEES